ncbi:hypothetical protein BpHYR1_004794 [Brachionus plicatilis]|uniref:Uncharacterized protein n=1 Tax=Brachionus plicatilis TaxID=10195 RepID=A0A3M7PVY9_BRAPC|nr:hypothetical protein BpHYR1_004794 [Brachionus plicatilis]
MKKLDICQQLKILHIFLCLHNYSFHSALSFIHIVLEQTDAGQTFCLNIVLLIHTNAKQEDLDKNVVIKHEDNSNIYINIDGNSKSHLLSQTREVGLIVACLLSVFYVAGCLRSG